MLITPTTVSLHHGSCLQVPLVVGTRFEVLVVEARTLRHYVKRCKPPGMLRIHPELHKHPCDMIRASLGMGEAWPSIATGCLVRPHLWSKCLDRLRACRTASSSTCVHQRNCAATMVEQALYQPCFIQGQSRFASSFALACDVSPSAGDLPRTARQQHTLR
jgi:hypothetical protein